MKKIISFSVFFLLLSIMFSGCSKEDDEILPDVQLKTYNSGINNGFFWSLWKSDGLTGSVNYSNGDAGNYSVSWNMNGNFTCGKGWDSGSWTRVVGYNCGSFSLNGGGGSMAYYGWTRNPLMEYYVNEKWGSHRPADGASLATISSDGGTYNVYTSWRSNAPSIDGTQSFRQIYSTRTSQNSSGENHNITFANHANAWAAAGYGLGSDISPSAILLTEAWGTSNGYCNVTVWDAGSSGGTTPPPSGGSCTLTLRARSTDGQGVVSLVVGGNTVGTWTLGTSMSDKSVTLWSSKGDCYVEYANDASGRDVQIDYLSVNGSVRQAENQSYNTGVWQNNSCGGSNSEWMHCNGRIGFGNVSY
jgi:endo-1,4-beta-xylanase